MRVAGQPFLLTARTAAQWIGAIAMDTQGLYGLVPGLVADEDLSIMEQLCDQHQDMSSRWFHAARTALGRAGGRDWWWCRNLTTHSLGAWAHINGMLLRQNVNVRQIGYADWLDACYSMLWANADEEHRIKLDLLLCTPPMGEPVPQSPRQTRQMLAAFAAD